MQTKNDTSKPDTELKQKTGEGCSGATCSAWREVPQAEFQDYILHYPRDLVVDVARMCEPPMKTYNDFTLAKWPASIVAKVQLYDGSEYHRGKQPVYFLPNDHAQRTGGA